LSPYDTMIGRSKGFVGTCVNAFDEAGMCILDELPWSDVSAFAVADENARTISREQFTGRVVVPEALSDLLDGPEVAYLEMDGVLALHDLDADIHYLFA